MKDLISKIKRRLISVGIIGHGYVGLSLALAFCKNFKGIGYDTNRTIIDSEWIH
jgi:UDP-N-acetyl-D-mannosaminuronate dehydrogenase